MAKNLSLDKGLNTVNQSVKDEDGKASPLTLSIDKVGIGHPKPERLLHLHSKKARHPQLRLSDPEGAWELFGGLDFVIRSVIQGKGETKFIIRPSGKVEVLGSISATGDVQLVGADCAEEFNVDVNQALEPGTVMVIGNEDHLQSCTKAYDKRVAGVLSGAGDFKPGIVLDKQSSTELRKPLALTGKVFCKVDAQYGAIEVGDLLTTSLTPGFAMKVLDPLKAFGAVIGKALRPLKEGQGLVPILIALQ